MFCCGENGKGQCGRSMQAQQQILSATKLPRCSLTHSLSCGSNHCLAVLRRVGQKKQELWAWGSNDKGQAGGTAGVTCPAARLRLPRDARIEAAWCGFSSSAVICSDRRASSLSSSRAHAPIPSSEAAIAANGGEEEEQATSRSGPALARDQRPNASPTAAGDEEED